MDCQARDNRDFSRRLVQPAFDSCAIAHENATGHGEGLVEPGVVDGAAIDFRLEAQIIAWPRDFGHRLQLERWRIAMGGRNLEMAIVKLGANLERDDRRAIPRREI